MEAQWVLDMFDERAVALDFRHYPDCKCGELKCDRLKNFA
jgi:hypothetical protein